MTCIHIEEVFSSRSTVVFFVSVGVIGFGIIELCTSVVDSKPVHVQLRFYFRTTKVLSVLYVHCNDYPGLWSPDTSSIKFCLKDCRRHCHHFRETKFFSTVPRESARGSDRYNNKINPAKRSTSRKKTIVKDFVFSAVWNDDAYFLFTVA